MLAHEPVAVIQVKPNIHRSRLGGNPPELRPDEVHDSLTGIWVTSILVASTHDLRRQVRATRLGGTAWPRSIHVAPLPAHSSPRRAAYVPPNPLALHQIAHGGRYGRGFLHR